MAGYVQNVDHAVSELVECLDSPALGLLQWQDELAIIRNRLPAPLVASLEAILAPHCEELEEAEVGVAKFRGAGGITAKTWVCD